MTTQTVEETDGTELSDSQKLYNLAEKTDDNGNVNVEFTEWEMTDDEITLTFVTPYGESVTKSFERPKANTREYEIVRVLESVGYGVASIDVACEENVKVPADPENDWELAPNYRPPLLAFVKDWVENEMTGTAENGSWKGTAGVILFAPLVFLLALPALVKGEINDFGYGILAGFMGCALWLGTVLAILL